MSTTAFKEDLLAAIELMEDVLRAGEPLAPEYPLIFQKGFPGRVVALSEGDDPRSACAVLVREFVMPGTTLRVGLIGSVSTQAEFRNRGLATAVLEAAESQLRDEGCVISMLWADDPRFYVERGYRPVGWECDFQIANELRTHLPETAGVRAALPEDSHAIHELYSAHPVRVERTAEETRALLECPDMSTLVVVRRDVVVAYACLGRGRDMANIVHEWAGATEDVLRLLRGHLEGTFDEAAHGQLFLMAPPTAADLRARLTALGVPVADGILGLAKLLDRKAAGELMRTKIEPAGSVVIEPDPKLGTRVCIVGEKCGVELGDDEILYLLMPARGLREDIDDMAEGFGITLNDLPIQPFCWGLDSI